MKKRTLVGGMALGLGLAMTTASASPITPVRLLGGAKVYQFLPAANATYLAWSSNSLDRPNHFDAFEQQFPLNSTSPTRINPAGTTGWMGGFDGDTTVGIYQVVNGDSNIREFNTSDPTQQSAPPTGINTSAWEWGPTMSEGFIEFGRVRYFRASSPSSVMLYDPNTQDVRTLATKPVSCRCIVPDQVSTQYATWHICIKICQSYYYDISSGQTHRIPNPDSADQYSVAVNGATNTFYFGRDSGKCGVHAKVMRWTIGDATPTTVSVMPRGSDPSGSLYVYQDATPQDDLYFGQYRCGTNNGGDIYEVVAANTADPSVVRVGTASTVTTSAAQRPGSSRAAWRPDSSGSYPFG